MAKIAILGFGTVGSGQKVRQQQLIQIDHSFHRKSPHTFQYLPITEKTMSMR